MPRLATRAYVVYTPVYRRCRAPVDRLLRRLAMGRGSAEERLNSASRREGASDRRSALAKSPHVRGSARVHDGTSEDERDRLIATQGSSADRGECGIDVADILRLPLPPPPHHRETCCCVMPVRASASVGSAVTTTGEKWETKSEPTYSTAFAEP